MGDKTVEEIGGLKVGRYVIFDGKVCTIKDVQKSKPGKHGATKCRVEAVALIDGSKTVKVMPSSERVDVPIIEKKIAQVISIQDGKASVMDMESYETLELIVPEELKNEVKEGVQVVYWILMDEKIIKQIKS
ncbi:MAG: translation initiation factor IF-5A [Candidatus Woesearchaeota archaeon]|nr:MAG: translation initiation factor IF-5A [Candidatus Woesearchaeota archaeon]